MIKFSRFNNFQLLNHILFNSESCAAIENDTRCIRASGKIGDWSVVMVVFAGTVGSIPFNSQGSENDAIQS